MTRWLRSAGSATSVASMSTPRPSTGSSAAARRRCRSRSTSTKVGRYQATTCMSLPWARSISSSSRAGSMTSADERSWLVCTYTVCTPASAIASMSVRSTDGVAPANSLVQSYTSIHAPRPRCGATVQLPGGGSGRSSVRTTSTEATVPSVTNATTSERDQALPAAPALAPATSMEGPARPRRRWEARSPAYRTADDANERGPRITRRLGPSASASLGRERPLAWAEEPRPVNLLRGAGGNRTLVRQAGDARATTIPETCATTAGAPPGRRSTRGARRQVFP